MHIVVRCCISPSPLVGEGWGEGLRDKVSTNYTILKKSVIDQGLLNNSSSGFLPEGACAETRFTVNSSSMLSR